MKKILITGSNGFLGQKLIEILRNQSAYNLIATSKAENRYPIEDGYIYESINILMHEEVKDVFFRHKPDIVIHTAALTNADDCENDPKLAEALNVTATENIARLCNENNIYLVHLSTDFVFDGLNGPYSEEDEPMPLSVYGITKLQSEKVVQELANRYSILRTILVYGFPKDPTRSNIVLWAKSTLESGTPIKVVNDQWRMPTLVDDLAACCLMAAEKNAIGLFHISGSQLLRISDIVYLVADFWKLSRTSIVEVSASKLNQAAKRPLKTGFVLDKAINELGYQPHSFNEGLEIMARQMNTSVNGITIQI